MDGKEWGLHWKIYIEIDNDNDSEGNNLIKMIIFIRSKETL